MACGSLIGALGIVLLVYASHPAAYLGVWVILGVAIASNLYDPAFATLGRIFGIGARRPITILTLAGGFASTASWPATQIALTFTDWRGTYLLFAAVLALVAAPLARVRVAAHHARSRISRWRNRDCSLRSSCRPRA